MQLAKKMLVKFWSESGAGEVDGEGLRFYLELLDSTGDMEEQLQALDGPACLLPKKRDAGKYCIARMF